jgi:hypothetical protein
MIDPRLAWFAIGALFGAALFGWPWHPRFNRYSRRGSNPPSPGRKPAPPPGPPEQPLTARLIRYWAWEQEQTAQLVRYWAWEQEQVGRAWLDPALGDPWPENCEPAPPAVPRYGWGPRQLNPPPPAPGMRREWIWSPSQMAECGGPCWEAQDPRYCVCGALWLDVPLRMDEGQSQRGNGNGGPTTPKPPIKPQRHGGYQPRPSNRTPNPPPSEP